jgi:tight adherence protein B
VSWLVGVLVAAGVLAVPGTRGRAASPVARDGPAAERPRSKALTRAWRARRRDVRSGSALELVVTDVAARLRAGASPATAWEGALGRRTGREGPTVDDLVSAAEDREQAAVVVAAGRLAADLGTPLAPLLDLVVHQLAAQAEAEGERRAALAGPRATARVLTWLPVLGVLLGTAVGADPVAVLLDAGVGTSALLAGLMLLMLGRVWSARLARVAADAGRPT